VEEAALTIITYPEDGGSRFLQNAGIYLSNYMRNCSYLFNLQEIAKFHAAITNPQTILRTQDSLGFTPPYQSLGHGFLMLWLVVPVSHLLEPVILILYENGFLPQLVCIYWPRE